MSSKLSVKVFRNVNCIICSLSFIVESFKNMLWCVGGNSDFTDPSTDPISDLCDYEMKPTRVKS